MFAGIQNLEEKFQSPPNRHVSLLYQLLTLAEESCSSSQCKSMLELLCSHPPCAVMHVPRQAQAVSGAPPVLHALFWGAQCLEALSEGSTAPGDASSRSSQAQFFLRHPQVQVPPTLQC